MVKPALDMPGRVPYGDDEIINWLYVEDAARAVVLACRSATTKTRSFNIDGEIHTVKEAVDLLKKFVPGAKVTLLSGHTGFTALYYTAEIKEEIGYRPLWPLTKGMKKVIREVRKLKKR